LEDSFWAKWLYIVSLIVLIAGFCFAFVFPYLVPEVLEVFFVELTGSGFDSISPGEFQFVRLLSGVIGALMIGWGGMMAGLAFRLRCNPEDWIWSLTAISAILWYSMDMVASAMAGSLYNMLLNTTILILLLPPFFKMRSNIAKGWRAVGW
jgi:hypothetical protein